MNNLTDVAFLPGLLLAVAMPQLSQAQPSPLPAVDSQILPSVQESQPSMAFLSRQRAYRYTTPVHLWPGRSVAIDFRTDESISFIQLSDLSQIVFQTNTPLETKQAKIIILRLIEPLQFEGQTTTTVPTLTVITTDPDGVLRTYLFNLYARVGLPDTNDANGVAIVATPEEVEAERTALMRRQNGFSLPREQKKRTVVTRLGHATATDIARGLEVAISMGYTALEDPIVFSIRELVAQTLNGADIFSEIERLNLNLAIVTELGRLGIQQQLLPLPTSESSHSDLPAEPSGNMIQTLPIQERFLQRWHSDTPALTSGQLTLIKLDL